MMKSLVCPDCSSAMILKESRYGPFYGCIAFPKCRATHGAHPDGRPLGFPADKETKQARIAAHQAFDTAWKTKGMTRKEAYKWLAKLMHVHKNHAHIGHFSKGECRKLIRLLEPYNLPSSAVSTY